MTRRPEPDLRFADFCRTGEPAALGDVFDATAAELLRVAVWLAGNRIDAEDLLQRTFLCAIEKRRQFETGARVVPWLMGILALEARHLRRERDRRLLPASLAPHRDPQSEVAARELAAAVEDIGEKLGEPYRDVLLLHLQQGLDAKEIAERLNRPGGTVRTQLVRAMALLRSKLPGGFVAGFAPLALADPSALAVVRAAVVRSAELVAPWGVGSVTTWTFTGLSTMSKKSAAVAAVVVFLTAFGIGVWLLREDVWVPTLSQPVAAPSEPRGPSPSESAPTAELQRTMAPVEPLGTYSSAMGSLLVQLYWQRDDSPAAAVGVAVWPLSGSELRQELLGVSDAAGRCRFDALPPGEYAVKSASGMGRRASVEAGSVCTVRLPASHAATVRGVVVDEFERPVAEADIWVSEELNGHRGYVVASSDALGRFSVPTSSNAYIGARKVGYIASYLRGYHAMSGATQPVHGDFEFTLRLRGAAGGVRGKVVDAHGQPVAGARVLVGAQQLRQAPGARGLNGEFEPRGNVSITDQDGMFHRADVPPGPTELRAWAVGHGPVRNEAVVQVGAEAAVVLQLPAAASLRGVVRDAEGVPVEGAELRIGAARDFFAASTRSEVDGGFRFADLGGGEVTVEVMKAGALQAATAEPRRSDGPAATAAADADPGRRVGGDLKVVANIVLTAGATTTWNPVLAATRTVRGIVLDPSGQPMRRAYVGLASWVGGGGGGSADRKVDEAGRFAFTDVDPERMQILTVRSGSVFLRKVAVPPGQDEVTIRIGELDLPTAAVRLRLVDAAGGVLAGRVMRRSLGDNSSEALPQDPATGVCSEDAIRPGTYELWVFTEAMVFPLPPLHLGAHERKDLGDVVVPMPASLQLFVTTAEGVPARAGWIDLVDARGQSCLVNPPDLADGRLTVVAPPGSWTLLVNGRNANATAAVTLHPGRASELRVTLAEGREVPVTIEPEPGVFAFGMVRVLVHARDGTLRWSGNVLTRRDGSLVTRVRLPIGDHEFSVLGADASWGGASCTVPAEGAITPLRIALRAAR